jgi:hypothetical protein
LGEVVVSGIATSSCTSANTPGSRGSHKKTIVFITELTLDAPNSEHSRQRGGPNQTTGRFLGLYRLSDAIVVIGKQVVIERGAHWWGSEAAVKASLLIALVFIFAHLSSQKLLPLAHEGRGSSRASDVLAEIGTDRADTRAKSEVPAYCSITACDQSLNESCPVTSLSCENCLTKEYPAGTEVSVLIDNPAHAAPPFRATRTKCIESVAINSSTRVAAIGFGLVN